MDSNQLSASDHMIATDMLFEAKAGIKDIAAAITETPAPEIRSFLTQELKTAIAQHEQIYGFLQDRGIYNAYNLTQQLEKDIEYANRALSE